MNRVLLAARRAMRDMPLARSMYVRWRLLRRRQAAPHGVIFLFYHGMAARDRPHFVRQLRRLRDFGDLTGLTDAVRFLRQPPVAERRICLTLDDGLAGAFQHALPILAELHVPAAYFVVPGWIDASRPGVAGWDECRRAAAAGMEIGSHSLTHRRLSELDAADVTAEFSRSRARIEAEIRAPCLHFACPFGQPVADFDPDRDPGLARESGYQSFLTTHAKTAAFDPWAILLPRVRMEPSWGESEIRYALQR